MSGDSCVSQLLSTAREIYKNFDYNPSVDIRGVFLDILKAFDKVWYDGLHLNGQTSSWKNILAGVPPGFLLGQLLFLIYI